MRDLLMVVGGGLLGWYLAQNREKQTLKVIENLNKQVSQLSKELVTTVKESEYLNNVVHEETI